jgi:hypothetical protein
MLDATRNQQFVRFAPFTGTPRGDGQTLAVSVLVLEAAPAAGLVGRVQPLGHDALELQSTCHGRPILVDRERARCSPSRTVQRELIRAARDAPRTGCHLVATGALLRQIQDARTERN